MDVVALFCDLCSVRTERETMSALTANVEHALRATLTLGLTQSGVLNALAVDAEHNPPGAADDAKAQIPATNKRQKISLSSSSSSSSAAAASRGSPVQRAVPATEYTHAQFSKRVSTALEAMCTLYQRLKLNANYQALLQDVFGVIFSGESSPTAVRSCALLKPLTTGSRWMQCAFFRWPKQDQNYDLSTQAATRRYQATLLALQGQMGRYGLQLVRLLRNVVASEYSVHRGAREGRELEFILLAACACVVLRRSANGGAFGKKRKADTPSGGEAAEVWVELLPAVSRAMDRFRALVGEHQGRLMRSQFHIPYNVATLAGLTLQVHDLFDLEKKDHAAALSATEWSAVKSVRNIIKGVILPCPTPLKLYASAFLIYNQSLPPVLLDDSLMSYASEWRFLTDPTALRTDENTHTVHQDTGAEPLVTAEEGAGLVAALRLRIQALEFDKLTATDARMPVFVVAAYKACRNKRAMVCMCVCECVFVYAYAQWWFVF
jgi:hypothetical protein